MLSTSDRTVRRGLIIALGLERSSFLVSSWVAAFTQLPGHHPTYFGLLSGATLWAGVPLLAAWRRSRLLPALTWFDIGAAAGFHLLVPVIVPLALADTAVNWAEKTDIAAATLAVVVLRPRWAIAGVLVLIMTFPFGVVPAVRAGYYAPTDVFVHINWLVWLPAVAAAVLYYLTRQNARLDEATARMIEAETRRAADLARAEERRAQRRVLHDTVLATLTAISRGGLDHRGEEVRQRCARDAAYLRRHIHEDEIPRDGLLAELDAVCADAEALNLRIRLTSNSITEPVAPHVRSALAAATREALNNVLAHSGTQEAWITLTGTSLWIVDRGRGFTPGAWERGTGVRESIIGRMRDVGGTARIDSAPGEGTCVELRWPAR